MPRSIIFFVILLGTTSAAPKKLSYDRDVKPLLSDTCFRCHGPDTANNKPSGVPLRLDSLESATAPRDGIFPVVPGDTGASAIITRIFSDDPDELMPPSDSHLVLTSEQKAIVRRWVEEGANYEKHWSFVPPEKAALPEVGNASWAKNEIDAFVLDRLRSEGLSPAVSAPPEKLVRRATLALTGLQPTPDEVDAYVADTRPDAYLLLLDRLLASPRYGEHMAVGWLEAARFADTDGYQNDGERTLWPWRDWVIQALNQNMPYDQFSIKQLAGDMLPEATDQDILASAFNRNHRINNEGGALPEEFIVEYAIDRVETTGTIWLGLTAGCARCHDHKYDPLTQKEFYQLYAYFNSIPEKGKDAGRTAAPNIRTRSPFSPDDGTEDWLRAKRSELVAERLTSSERQAIWERNLRANNRPDPKSWSIPTASKADTTQRGSKLKPFGDGSFVYQGPEPKTIRYSLTVRPAPGIAKLAALRIEALPLPQAEGNGKLARSANGNFVVTNILVRKLDKNGHKSEPLKWGGSRASFSQDGYPVADAVDTDKKTGWAVSGAKGAAQAVFAFAEPATLAEGDQLYIEVFHESRFSGHNIGRIRLGLTGETADRTPAPDAPAFDPKIVTALDTSPADRSDQQRRALADYFQSQDSKIQSLVSEITELERELEKMTVSVLVMDENEKPNPAYLLNRGAYDQPDKSEVLQRGIPASIIAPNSPQPSNRLELARWLVSHKNPLAARVFVNLIWQQHFGVGLVKTAEDFGAQGERPSHPELLDWLACEFMDSGWDMKHLHKTILSSATWKQDSAAPREAYTVRPENRLLDRGPRFRLSGYSIRDAALASSGLLVERLGGAPVKPYQPAGLWQSMAANAGTRYVPSAGDGLYRRSLYTYWKRAVNPPRQIIFDGATREMCSVTFKRTNTPLQALVLMNDVTFVEAARALATRMILEGGLSDESRLRYGWRLATGTIPSINDLAVAKTAFSDFLTAYRNDAASAQTLLDTGESPVEPVLDDPAEFAAYTAAAHLFLNLDRAITLE